MAQPGVNPCLPFFGRVIFRVFAQIAVRPSLQDLLREFVAQFIFERRDLACSFFFRSSMAYFAYYMERFARKQSMRIQAFLDST